MSNVVAGAAAGAPKGAPGSPSAAPGSQVVYQSRVQVEPGPAKLKQVHLPQEPCEPCRWACMARSPRTTRLPKARSPRRAATLDYVVGATAGCLMGTFNGALQARQIDTTGGRLRGEAIGDVEVEDGVLVIRRIRMIVHVRADASHRAAVERVAEVYAARCPCTGRCENAIDISTELDFDEGGV